MIPEVPVSRALVLITPLTRPNYDLVTASGSSILQPSFSVEFILIKCPNSVSNVLLILTPTFHTSFIQYFHCLARWGGRAASVLWSLPFSPWWCLWWLPQIVSLLAGGSRLAWTSLPSHMNHLLGTCQVSHFMLTALCLYYLTCVIGIYLKPCMQDLLSKHKHSIK